MKCLVRCTDKGITLAERAQLANSFYSRLMGLMFKKRMDNFDGMIITRCYSIHTFFMNFPIDVIFLDKENKVVKILRHLSPWRLSGIYWKASQVLELEAGKLSKEIKVSDRIEVLCTN